MRGPRRQGRGQLPEQRDGRGPGGLADVRVHPDELRPCAGSSAGRDAARVRPPVRGRVAGQPVQGVGDREARAVVRRHRVQFRVVLRVRQGGRVVLVGHVVLVVVRVLAVVLVLIHVLVIRGRPNAQSLRRRAHLRGDIGIAHAAAAAIVPAPRTRRPPRAVGHAAVPVHIRGGHQVRHHQLSGGRETPVRLAARHQQQLSPEVRGGVGRTRRVRVRGQRHVQRFGRGVRQLRRWRRWRRQRCYSGHAAVDRGGRGQESHGGHRAQRFGSRFGDEPEFAEQVAATARDAAQLRGLRSTGRNTNDRRVSGRTLYLT